MREISWDDLTAAGLSRRPAALTIGVFDGLHLGHQSLISSITTDSELDPVVVTFARHPAEVLAPDRFPGFIMSREQKRAGLEAQGVAITVLIDFSREFAQISGATFLDALIRAFDLRFAAIGHDFRCGHEMSMDAEAVRVHFADAGIPVKHFPAVANGDTIVSSTRIRHHIAMGNLREAATLMGRPLALDVSGEIMHAEDARVRIPLDGRRRLQTTRQVVPPPGRYPATVVSAAVERETVVTVDENSVSLPLAADSRIRYIVLQDNRV